MKIVGIEKNSGEYQGVKFDNTILYYEVVNNNIIGTVTKPIKISSKTLFDILKHYKINDINQLLGLNIADIYYDKYQRVKMIIFG